MPMTILANCTLFDGLHEDFIQSVDVVVEDDKIREVSSRPVRIAEANYIDCERRLLMPGLIDAHVHAYTPTFNFYSNDRMPPSLMANHAAVILSGMLHRGFTTVRDAGGGDVGLSLALRDGVIRGPRFLYSGKSISQTGGHGHLVSGETCEPCMCGAYSGYLSRVADGVEGVRLAVREELYKGAHQIKIHASGGVTSPSDPIWMLQYTEAEIRTAVEEAASRRTYVMAHCHTDSAARRCIACGVRSLEHGTSISSETASMIAEANAFVVPTLSVMSVIKEFGSDLGMPPASLGKFNELYGDAFASIDRCRKAGVKVGLGSDLTDHRFHKLQGRELRLRAEVSRPIEVLLAATSINAELLNLSGKVGEITAGAFADILVLDFNPLTQIDRFEDPRHFHLIMHGGELIKDPGNK